MYKLAEDVTHRIFTGLKGILENESEVPQLSSFLIIKCFQEGKSKSGFFSKITNNCGGKLGNKKEVENAGIKLRNIFEKFTTEDLFCKPAIRKNDCIFGETSEYLYRYAFFKENLMFSDRKVIQFDNYKELNSIRIETVDHFTFLSSQKGALLKQLYTKLQSPEFNALKEVAVIMAKNQNEFLKNQKDFHMKSLLFQRELLNNQKKSLKNQEEHQKQILKTNSPNHNTTFKVQIINMFCGQQGYRNRYNLINRPSGICTFLKKTKISDFGTTKRIFIDSLNLSKNLKFCLV